MKRLVEFGSIQSCSTKFMHSGLPGLIAATKARIEAALKGVLRR